MDFSELSIRTQTYPQNSLSIQENCELHNYTIKSKPEFLSGANNNIINKKIKKINQIKVIPKPIAN
jgi:hypothetical protein